jgi:hypothetical protein
VLVRPLRKSGKGPRLSRTSSQRRRRSATLACKTSNASCSARLGKGARDRNCLISGPRTAARRCPRGYCAWPLRRASVPARFPAAGFVAVSQRALHVACRRDPAFAELHIGDNASRPSCEKHISNPSLGRKSDEMGGTSRPHRNRLGGAHLGEASG